MDNKVRNRGVLDLAGISIPCYVLEDGTRVLSSRGMQQALNMVEDNNRTSARLTRYLSQETLKPFIYKDKSVGHFDPIICYDGEAKINGYEATVLVDICDAFLEARKHIKLSSRQAIIADQCEFLERTDEEREHTDEDCDHCYYQLYGGDCQYSNCQRKFRETTFTCKKTGNKMYYERKVYRMPRYKRDAIILKCDRPMPQKCDMYKEQIFESYETLDSKR